MFLLLRQLHTFLVFLLHICEYFWCVCATQLHTFFCFCCTATHSLRSRRTLTCTGRSSATTWPASTTTDPSSLRPSSLSCTSISSSNAALTAAVISRQTMRSVSANALACFCDLLAHVQVHVCVFEFRFLYISADVIFLLECHLSVIRTSDMNVPPVFMIFIIYDPVWCS